MISLTGFLRSLRNIIIVCILYVSDLKGKLKLFIAFFLSSCPSIKKLARKYAPLFIKKLQVVERALIRNVYLNIGGITYIPLDIDSIHILFPNYERDVLNCLKLKKGDIFIDVGAHVGKYALMAACVVGEGGLVVALEPDPENYKTLMKAVKVNGFNNIIVLNIAAYSENTRLKLFRSLGSAGHSIKWCHGSEYVEVNARKLDDILKELNIQKVDWIKIDVEGAELEVLKGLKDTLTTSKPRLIIEITKENLEAVLGLLRGLSYVTVPIRKYQDYCVYYGE